jgi:hypothetical protein
VVRVFLGARTGCTGCTRDWFRLSPRPFDAINYAGIAPTSICNLLFFLVPALVLYW